MDALPPLLYYLYRKDDVFVLKRTSVYCIKRLTSLHYVCIVLLCLSVGVLLSWSPYSWPCQVRYNLRLEYGSVKLRPEYDSVKVMKYLPRLAFLSDNFAKKSKRIAIQEIRISIAMTSKQRLGLSNHLQLYCFFKSLFKLTAKKQRNRKRKCQSYVSLPF